MKIKLAVMPAAAVGLSLAVLAAPVTARGSTSARTARTAQWSAGGARSSAAATDPETSPLEPLAGRIGSLGETSYPAVYAGVRIDSGALDVYVTSGDDSALLAAIGAVNTAHLPYTVIQVPRSYGAQLATSQWIAQDQKTLNSQGIVPEWWGPDPASDAIQVAFQQPTSSQLTTLQNTIGQLRRGTLGRRAAAVPAGIPATAGNYQDLAADAMNAEAPSADDIVAYGSALTPGVASNGFGDTKPFFGADKIWYTLDNNGYCTTNFSFNGASNGSNHFVVTAAHCSGEATGRDQYTCATTVSHSPNGDCNYDVGTVGRVLYSDDDFETILSSNLGGVWNDSTNDSWSVNGFVIGEVGDALTVDGATDGATYGIKVEVGGGASCATYANHTVCHALVLESGHAICPRGDSGGPILERESGSNNIYAAGIILGTGTSLGSYFCYGQQIYWLRDEANLRLVYGS